MKFVYTAGDYAERDGVPFLFGNPAEVENRSTIEKLLKDPSFRRVEDEEKKAPAEKVLIPRVGACPKCGRMFGTRLTMHVRFCRGPA